jgi:hypothetical protein
MKQHTYFLGLLNRPHVWWYVFEARGQFQLRLDLSQRTGCQAEQVIQLLRRVSGGAFRDV